MRHKTMGFFNGCMLLLTPNQPCQSTEFTMSLTKTFVLLYAGSSLCAIVSQTLPVPFKQFSTLQIGDHVFDSITGMNSFIITDIISKFWGVIILIT